MVLHIQCGIFRENLDRLECKRTTRTNLSYLCPKIQKREKLIKHRISLRTNSINNTTIVNTHFYNLYEIYLLPFLRETLFLPLQE
jgi:hypothetical protein